VTTSIKKMVFTPVMFEIYRVLKCNEKRLPKNFPGRPFTDVNLADYELMILCGNIGAVYKDMYILNTWVLGKYGKNCWSESVLDERGRAMLEVIRGLVNTTTIEDTSAVPSEELSGAVPSEELSEHNFEEDSGYPFG
jgi:hypothetical protein